MMGVPKGDLYQHMRSNVWAYIKSSILDELRNKAEGEIRERPVRILEYGSGGSTLQIMKAIINENVSKSVEFISVERDTHWWFAIANRVMQVFSERHINFQEEVQIEPWSMVKVIGYVSHADQLLRKQFLQRMRNQAIGKLRRFKERVYQEPIRPYNGLYVLRSHNVLFKYRLIYMVSRDLDGTHPYSSYYVNYPEDLAFDRILIDGDCRRQILARIADNIDLVTDNCKIFLHDAHRAQYQDQMHKFPRIAVFVKGEGDFLSGWQSDNNKSSYCNMGLTSVSCGSGQNK